MTNRHPQERSNARTPRECHIAAKSEFEFAEEMELDSQNEQAEKAFAESHSLYERGIANANGDYPRLDELHAGAGAAMLRIVSLHSRVFGRTDECRLPQIQNARKHFETALTLHPADPAPIRAHLGKAFFYHGKAADSPEEYGKAISAYEKAISAASGAVIIDPIKNHANYRALAGYVMDKAYAHCSLASSLLRAGNPHDALPHNADAAKLSSESCGMQPDNQSLRLIRAEILAQYALTALEAGDLHLAPALALQSRDLDPNAIRAQFISGKIAIAVNDYHTAITELGKVLETEPSHKEALVSLGQCYQRMGIHSQAEKFLNHAADLDDPEPALIVALASSMFELRRVDDAIEHLKFALEMDPDNYSAHHNLGRYYCDIEQWDEARLHILKALRQNPNSAGAHMLLGITLAQKGMIDLDRPDQSPALVAHRKAQELAPDDETIVEELAKSLIAHNLTDEAERMLSAAMTRQTIQSLRLDAIFKKRPQPVA